MGFQAEEEKEVSVLLPLATWASGIKAHLKVPSLPSGSCSITHEPTAGQLLLGSDHGLKTNGPMPLKAK